MRKTALIICIFALMLCLAGCSSSGTVEDKNNNVSSVSEISAQDNTQKTEVKITVPIYEDTKFGAALLDITPEEFEAAGFKLGDSCDIYFDNGYELKDVPFYDGYYVRNEEPVIIAYPGVVCIKITLNNKGIWDEAELMEGYGVTVSLNESGKYLPMQETLGQEYSDNHDDYTSDVQFCNFRELTGGNIKEHFLYRGASSVDNYHNRATYTDKLLEDAGIQFIVNLADSEEDIEEYMTSDDFNSPYSAKLYESGKMVLLDMGNAFETEGYQKKVVSGLRQMMNSEGPVYIHCMEGKDRTGFVCMLIEALSGATYDEMLNDYMITYDNYYHVTENDKSEEYEGIKELYFDSFMEYMHGTDDEAELKNADYSEDAREYLKAGGMTDAEVDKLYDFICNGNSSIPAEVEKQADIIINDLTGNGAQLTGGWVKQNTSDFSDMEKDAFEKAVANEDDMYTPLALKATQVVAGTNYCFLCKVEHDGNMQYELVYIYRDLDGNASITDSAVLN